MAEKAKNLDNRVHCPCCGTTLGDKNGVIDNFKTKCPKCKHMIKITIDNYGRRKLEEVSA